MSKKSDPQTQPLKSPPRHLPAVCSFWHGPLSWLEKLSIASFLAKGHAFKLFSYRRPDDLPSGAEWIDATELAPESSMFFYKGNRSPAVFADYLRLLMLKAEVGVWVDCDMLCIRPFSKLGDYTFGMEVEPGNGTHAGQINNAVLGMPSDSELLGALLSIFESSSDTIDPVWLPAYRRAEVAIRRAFGQKVGLTHMQFGATGPFPLTYYARKYGIDHLAKPKNVFYPLDYRDAASLLASGSRLESVVAQETLGVHLWRMALTDRSRATVPTLPDRDSALGCLAAKLDISLLS